MHESLGWKITPVQKEFYIYIMSYYKNKTIWITGASSGIGKELAIQLSQHDNQLIISSRKKNLLEEVKSKCKNPEKVIVIPLDLENHEGIEKTFNENIQFASQTDILFNNAGLSQRSFANETSFAVYKKLIDVNYLGTVKLSTLLLPYFQKRNSGHYVVITSVAGKFGVPVRSGYSGSKFALHGFFEALRAELAKTKIKVSMVCPGFIKTDISLNALTGDGSKQGTMDDGQANGMPVDQMVSQVLNAVSRQNPEILVGGFYETKLAVWISRVFPAFFRKLIANSKVT